MNNTVLFLTACINTNNMSYTILQDKDIRIKQYFNTINWYLKNTNFKILVVENSGYNMAQLFSTEEKENRIEFLTFNGNSYDRNLGKGYGEALILDYGIKNSIILKESSRIIKITGRFIIKNINTLIEEAKHEKYIYANNMKVNSQLMTKSQFFICPKSFIEDYFLTNINNLNDSLGYYFEHLLFDSIKIWKDKGFKHKEFLSPILIYGQSGSKGIEVKPKFPYLKSIINYYAHKIGIYYNLK